MQNIFLNPSLNNQSRIKAAVITACALPALYLLWQIYGVLQGANSLGANPVEAIIRRLGETSLIFLALTLLVTPLRKMFKMAWLVKLRRALGVTVFMYASLHLLAYAAWDQALNLQDVIADTWKRPFIFVGMLAWLILLPLAFTSFNAAIKWLGGKRWQMLHKSVYAVAILSCMHYWWMRAGKNNFDRPAVYIAIFAALLIWRVIEGYKNRTKKRTQ